MVGQTWCDDMRVENTDANFSARDFLTWLLSASKPVQSEVS